MNQLETLIVSDIHLGSSVCRSKILLETLKTLSFSRLILNGDIFDDLDFTRLNHDDWNLLSYLRECSNPGRGIEVVWIAGNHDGAAHILSRLIGIAVRNEYEFSWHGKKCLAIHGHQFDRFLNKNIVISAVASAFYLFVQRIDTERQFISRFLKRASKSWLRISQKVARGAVRHAEAKGAEIVFCGHTHRETSDTRGRIAYYNSGCWTDVPSAYIALSGNSIEIKKVM